MWYHNARFLLWKYVKSKVYVLSKKPRDSQAVWLNKKKKKKYADNPASVQALDIINSCHLPATTRNSLKSNRKLDSMAKPSETAVNIWYHTD